MMYLVQFCTFLGVTFLGIYYEWTPNPYALGIVAFFAALLVTAVIIEIRLLPSRLSRLHSRLFGLKDEPGDEVLRLPRTSWHVDNSSEGRSRMRIGKDPS